MGSGVLGPLGALVVGLLIGAVIIYFVTKPRTEQAYLDLQREVEQQRAAVEKETENILETTKA